MAASTGDRRNVQAFYFPLLLLVPGFDGDTVEAGPFQITKRRWQTSTFDLATLATKHKLHLPYQTMDVFLSSCNMELRIDGRASLEKATAAFRSFRLALYATGLSPFLSPFVTNYSINDYSGINSRDSESLRKDLPPGMEKGLTSEAGTLEAWPLELSFHTVVLPNTLDLTEDAVVEAAEKSAVWETLGAAGPLRAIEETANAAPMILPLGQSVLHIWSAIETLFPNVRMEVKFRIALYVSQLTASGPARLEVYDRVRASYDLRSSITHGSQKEVSMDQWQQTWGVLIDAYNALVRRGSLPAEQELIEELLS